MIGAFYYNETIRTCVAVFGTMFDNIYVARKNGTGGYSNQKKVPIAYGPRQKYIERATEREDLTADRVAIKLPRMSFEADAPLYDAERQKAKQNYQVLASTTAGSSFGARVWAPAPYIIPFELSIMSRNQDEVLQILEQIIPYFKPSLGIKIKPVAGVDEIVDEITIRLQGISKDDQYSGDMGERRLIVYSLSFDMLINVYGRIDQDVEVIKTAIVNIRDTDTSETYLTKTAAVNPQSADRDDAHTIDITNTFGFDSED